MGRIDAVGQIELVVGRAERAVGRARYKVLLVAEQGGLRLAPPRQQAVA